MPSIKPTQLSLGAARVDITPSVGGDLTGFIGRTSSSVGVHDALFVRAIFVQRGNTQAILISCDLLGLEATFVAAARRAIEHETGVPAQNITIACTHTHSGPASMYLRFCGDVDTGYMAQLLERLVQVAREARSTPVPATIAAGTTCVAGVSVNRRIPGGPVDEELDVVRFDDETGKAIASVVSFACHPIAFGGTNRLVSADYPGVLTQQLEEATGAVSLFLNGASAQINPRLKDTSLNAATGGAVAVQAMGAALAEAVLSLWSQLKTARRSTLAVQTRAINLPLQRVDEAMLEPLLLEHSAAIADLTLPAESAFLGIKAAMAMIEWAWETRDAMQNGRVAKSIVAEVQTLQLGDLIFVTVPGELFLEFGLQIKVALAPRRAIVSTYTNGNFGYFPTRKAFAEGGYETFAYRYYGYPSAFSPAAGARIVATVKDRHSSKGTK